MRNFIRHPACVPINIAIEKSSTPATAAIEVSAGGLSFQLSNAVPVGTQLTISMPQLWPDYFVRGTVVWCRSTAGGYLAGVEFSETNEAFKARMVAQFSQIENYRQRVRERDGRQLSSEQAAQEWIARFAEEFAHTIDWQQ